MGKDQHYPVPAPDAAALYAKYKEMSVGCKNVSFVGRLATYKYYNIDQVVGMSLAEFERLRKVL
jgi:UDP-galactopyranose mutase